MITIVDKQIYAPTLHAGEVARVKATPPADISAPSIYVVATAITTNTVLAVSEELKAANTYSGVMSLNTESVLKLFRGADADKSLTVLVESFDLSEHRYLARTNTYLLNSRLLNGTAPDSIPDIMAGAIVHADFDGLAVPRPTSITQLADILTQILTRLQGT